MDPTWAHLSGNQYLRGDVQEGNGFDWLQAIVWGHSILEYPAGLYLWESLTYRGWNDNITLARQEKFQTASNIVISEDKSAEESAATHATDFVAAALLLATMYLA
jgi:hypothetical protein